MTIRRLAVVAVLAVAGGAHAADAPKQLPVKAQIPGEAVPYVEAVPGVVAPALPPEAVPTTGGPVVISGAGCNGPACGGAAPVKGLGLGIAIGAGCENPVTCGSCASEKTFLFGSCRQFYNPGNDCGSGRCGSHHQFLLYGAGGLGDRSTCTYGSYMNR